MRDPTDLQAIADEKAQADLRQQSKREQEVADFKWLMADPRGRRFMNRLLAYTGLFRASTTCDNYAFRSEGRRDVGLFLLTDINDHTLDEYVQMMQEQAEHA